MLSVADLRFLFEALFPNFVGFRRIETQFDISQFRQWVRREMTSAEAEAFVRAADWLEDRGVRIIQKGDSDYPPNWRDVPSAPKGFFLLGAALWRERDVLAVVGSREPMRDSSLWVQRHLGEVLCRPKVALASGGARGIDQLCHRLALIHQVPNLVFLPSGLAKPYPHELTDMIPEILEQGGGVLSFWPPFSPLRKSHFHCRNRYLAGLARLVVVIEAQRQSGSMLTGLEAGRLGRELATLPVSPLSPRGLGNLDLLALGATLLRDGKDLRQAFDSARAGLVF